MSKSSREPRNRQSIRYDDYDYTSPGAYSITICAYRGKCIFGQVVDGEMQLNPLGILADECCVKFGENHPLIELNAYVVMPNHVHILFTIIERPPDADLTPKERVFGDAIAGSVSAYMGGYKGSVTQRAKNRGLIPGPPIWQERFWDRIVRGDIEFERHRNYIAMNPARWLEDQLHPDAPPNKFNRDWHTP